MCWKKIIFELNTEDGKITKNNNGIFKYWCKSFYDQYKSKDQSESHLPNKKTNMPEAKIQFCPKLRKSLLV